MAGVPDKMLPTFWTVLLVIFRCCHLLSGECHFPEILLRSSQTETRWLYHVTNSGHSHPAKAFYHVTNLGSRLEFVPESGPDVQDPLTLFRWECSDVTNDGDHELYLVTVRSGSSIHSRCVRFHQRSSEVIQLEYSTKLTYHEDARDCKMRALTLDNWPVIYFGPPTRDHYDCPIIGGFDITRIIDYNRKSYCSETSSATLNRPRIESNCAGDQDIFLDFQDCPQEKLIETMARQQFLKCRAHWQQGNHAFTVLSNYEGTSTWIMRTPLGGVPDDRTFFIDLLSDCVCDDRTLVAATEHYVTLEARQRVYDDVCMDATSQCKQGDLGEICGQVDGIIYCKETCGQCLEQTREPAHCTFPESSLGVWQSPDVTLTIEQSRVDISTMGQYTCLKSDDFYQYLSYALVRYVHDGCYPRIYCLSLANIGSLQAYRVQEGAIWPDYEQTYFCNPRTTVTHGHRDPTWMFAVPDRSKSSGNTCRLFNPSYSFNALFDNYERCSGRLSQISCDPNQSGLALHFSLCSDSSLKTNRVYSCVTSFIHEDLSGNGVTDVYVLHDVKRQEYICLGFKRESSDILYLTETQCIGLHLYDDVTPRATFDVTASTADCAQVAAYSSQPSIYSNCHLVVISIIIISVLSHLKMSL